MAAFEEHLCYVSYFTLSVIISNSTVSSEDYSNQFEQHVIKICKNKLPADIYLLNSAMDTLQQYVKSFRSSQWRHQNDVTEVVLVSLLLTWNRLLKWFWHFYCVPWTSIFRQELILIWRIITNININPVIIRLKLLTDCLQFSRLLTQKSELMLISMNQTLRKMTVFNFTPALTRRAFDVSFFHIFLYSSILPSRSHKSTYLVGSRQNI